MTSSVKYFEAEMRLVRNFYCSPMARKAVCAITAGGSKDGKAGSSTRKRFLRTLSKVASDYPDPRPSMDTRDAKTK